jgi:hypothetical protein
MPTVWDCEFSVIFLEESGFITWARYFQKWFAQKRCLPTRDRKSSRHHWVVKSRRDLCEEVPLMKRKEAVQLVHENLSKRTKALLLGVNLSSCYVVQKPLTQDVVTLMNEIQDIYASRPFQGYRRVMWDLKDLGHQVNHKKIYRLMKRMDLQVVYPKKNLSKQNHEHKVFPPQRPHDVWCPDIARLL